MTPAACILVVDDEADTLKVISSVLVTEGYRADTFTSPVQALQKLKEESYDAVLVDYKMPDMDGLEFLKAIKASDSDVPVILFTAYATLSHAVEAMKCGAYHYFSKPLNYEELKIVLKNSIMFHRLQKSHKRLEQEVYKTYNFHNVVGKSKLMKKVVRQIEALSRLNSCVLIQGEKGTGKELVAKTIHYNSRRKEAPFIVVDCSAIEESCLQKELFGENQGADKTITMNKGRIKEAEEGTLFIKEIHCLPLHVQAMLFSFLKENESLVSEGGENVKADVRVIVSTSAELEDEMEKGRFHKNLFKMLKAFQVIVPPLRDRHEDIPLLAEHFIKKYAQQFRKDIPCFSSSVYSRMLSHKYQENVSELERLVERACIACQSQCVGIQDIPELLRDNEDEGLAEGESSSFSKEKQKVLEQFEREYFISLLDQTHGRIGEAASICGIAERNIYEKLKKYGLRKEDFKKGDR